MTAGLRRITWKAALLTMLVSLLGVTIGLAASGDLDSTFGNDGQMLYDFAPLAGWAEDLAVQTDGMIVGVGRRFDPDTGTGFDVFIGRVEDDGDVDPTFGTGGLVIQDLGGYETAGGVLVDGSGMIVVTGQTCNTSWGRCDLVVWRFDADGDPDPGFNGGDPLIIDYDGADNGTFGGVALDSDGKIVVAGYKEGSTYEFAAYRINTDGTPDLTFSNDGMQRFGFGPGRDDYANAVVVYGTRIVLAGDTCGADGCDFAIARMRKPGGLDPTFSGDGLQTVDFGADDYAAGMARASLARMVVVGSRWTAHDKAKIAVARFDKYGNLDTTFSGDGKNMYGIGTLAFAMDVLIDSGNAAVVVGAGDVSGNEDLAVLRIRQAGGLDTGFSGDGKVFIDFGGRWEEGYGIAKDPSGKYVVGGGSWTPPATILARILP